MDCGNLSVARIFALREILADAVAENDEITSQAAPKLLQLQKEGRILDADGNYIRAPGTKGLIPVEGLSQVMRLD